MAAFAAKGIQGQFINIKNLYENRGVSFSIGGVSYILVNILLLSYLKPYTGSKYNYYAKFNKLLLS
jgi:hypothetical protein